MSEISVPRLHDRRVIRRRESATGSWAVTILGLALVAVAAWWVTHSRIFEAGTIHVRGNVHLTQPDVLRVAGLSGETNVLWFSPGAVANRLEQNPWVRSASVARSFPSTINVSIVERSAVAVVVSDRRYLVSADGTVLGVVGRGTDLPLIPGPARATVGSALVPTWPALVAVTGLPAALRTQVARVLVDQGSDGMVLVLRGGVHVVYGDATNAQAKGRALAAVLAWAARSGVTPNRVDVRAPSLPALLPSPAG